MTHRGSCTRPSAINRLWKRYRSVKMPSYQFKTLIIKSHNLHIFMMRIPMSGNLVFILKRGGGLALLIHWALLMYQTDPWSHNVPDISSSGLWRCGCQARSWNHRDVTKNYDTPMIREYNMTAWIWKKHQFWCQNQLYNRAWATMVLTKFCRIMPIDALEVLNKNRQTNKQTNKKIKICINIFIT